MAIFYIQISHRSKLLCSSSIQYFENTWRIIYLHLRIKQSNGNENKTNKSTTLWSEYLKKKSEQKDSNLYYDNISSSLSATKKFKSANYAYLNLFPVEIFNRRIIFFNETAGNELNGQRWFAHTARTEHHNFEFTHFSLDSNNNILLRKCL